MVLEKLGGSLREALRKIAGASYVDESLIKEIVRDIQRALIQADVNVQLALAITKQLQRRALEDKPPPGMSPREHVVRIIYEELVKILGATREVPLQKQRILLVGLYGQGKTTTAGKLAKFFQKKGLSAGLVAADVHRPAAYDQLKQLAEQINAPFYGDPGAKDAVKIAKAGVKALEGTDVIIVDSSGRHALEPDLIAEIEGVAKAVQRTSASWCWTRPWGSRPGRRRRRSTTRSGSRASSSRSSMGPRKGAAPFPPWPR